MRLQLDDPPIVEFEQSDFGNEWTRETTELGDLALCKPADPADAAIEFPGRTSFTTSVSTRELEIVPDFQNAFPIHKTSDRVRGYGAAPPPTWLTNHTDTHAASPPPYVSRSCRQSGEAVLERCFSSPPQSAMQSACLCVCVSRVKLDSVISFGDILSIRSNDRLARIGATGGVMGHVLLVTSKPMCVEIHTPEALAFHRLWPHVDVTCIWRVPVIESTRGVSGLYESTCLLYIDPKSGSIAALGDLAMNNGAMQIGQFEGDMPDGVQIFRCPPELRKLADEHLMRKALADVKASDASWSWTTAVRAFLLEGELTEQDDSYDPAARDKALQDLQACWTSEPICTSVVITFWQRYLCHLVEHLALPGVGNDALGAIFQYIPLKADRALPGELRAVLRSRSWETIASVPLAPKGTPIRNNSF